MSKSVIAPIIAVIALAVQFIFGIKIPEEVLNEVVVVIGNIVLVVTTIIGIVKNHNKNDATK